jgi:hypothetical protein
MPISGLLFLFCTVTFAEQDISIRENSFQTDCPIIRTECPLQFHAVIDTDVPDS